MLVLGIILVLIAGGAIVAALLGGAGQPAVFDLGGLEVQTNTLGAFLFGAATVLLLVIGLGMMRAGAARARRRRQERKELKRLKKLEGQESAAATTSAVPATGAHAGDTHAGGTHTGGTHADPAAPRTEGSPTTTDNPPPAR
jgi:hypothetical protein